MNILFWNTGLKKKRESNIHNINASLPELVTENNVDLLILAEYNADIQLTCNSINSQTNPRIKFNPIPICGCEKIRGLVKSKYNVKPLRDHSRYQIVKISTASYMLIIGMVHNVDKYSYTVREQEEVLRWFHDEIVAVEKENNCTNTIVIGDFNANPFEASCAGAGMMHGLPFIGNIADKPERTIQGRSYHKFYNPTWKFYGNIDTPHTTYHFDNGEIVNFYRNAFDQVMVRPRLINAFDVSKLKIIGCTSNHQLTKNGKPD